MNFRVPILVMDPHKVGFFNYGNHFSWSGMNPRRWPSNVATDNNVVVKVILYCCCFLSNVFFQCSCSPSGV